jgi:hypothetical protein
MVETIGPMVRGASDGGKRVKAAHLGGGLLGGATVGFAAGALGAGAVAAGASRSALVWFALGVGLLALLYDSFGPQTRLGLSRQTPRSWRYLLPHPMTAWLNGYDLGLGWSTRIYFASYFAMPATALVAADPLLGALAGAMFGGARAATVVALTGIVRQEANITDRLWAKRGAVKAANVATLCLLLAALLTTVL